MPVRADLDFDQPNVPIVKAANYHFNANVPVGRYHKCHTLDFKNGLAVQKTPVQSIGGTKTVQDLQIALPAAKDEEEFTWTGRLGWNESVASGQSRPKSAPAFRPRYCFLDKKVLRFYAYFEETAGLDDRTPEKRIRHVHILYYLEDDSISVLEPRVHNSGLYQGMLLKRHRIPRHDEPLHGDRTYWHWTDLRIGRVVDFYAKKYHLASCDDFTQAFLESEGINLNDREPLPADPYLHARLKSQAKKPITRLFAHKEKDVRQYLKNDRKVLRFYGISELPYYPLGCKGAQKYVIHFYLADDTLEVREVRSMEEPKGAGTFPKFLKRQKVPKGSAARPKSQLDFPSSIELSAADHYGPLDFTVGSSVYILQKKISIYDCDDFTQDFYRREFNIDMSRNVTVAGVKMNEKPESTLIKPPPHTITCVGTPEDSLQNCLQLQPKAPKRDYKKLLDYAGKNVRFEARMRSLRPEDEGRRFVITYHLADDTMTIFEPYIPNSGKMSSRFLIKSKVAKAEPKVNGEPDYFTIDDFYIGCRLRIHGFDFEITGADERVRKYLDHVNHPLPKHTEASLRHYFYGQQPE